MFVLPLLALQGCQSDHLARLAYSDCSAETLHSDGTVDRVTYDALGWPVQQVFDAEADEPELHETEYTRVAQRVVESITYMGRIARLDEYDGHEHLTFSDTNLEGDDGYTCELVHQGDGSVLLTSTCSNGVTTTYDLCDNPVDVRTPDGRWTFGYAYENCRILNVQMLGTDAAGPFRENRQYFAGREVSRIRDQGGDFSGSLTEWDCPAGE